MMNDNNEDAEEMKETVKEQIDLAVEITKQLSENEEIPKLNAKVAKLNYSALREEGFNPEDALVLTAAILGRK